MKKTARVREVWVQEVKDGKQVGSKLVFPSAVAFDRFTGNSEGHTARKFINKGFAKTAVFDFNALKNNAEYIPAYIIVKYKDKYIDEHDLNKALENSVKELERDRNHEFFQVHFINSRKQGKSKEANDEENDSPVKQDRITKRIKQLTATKYLDTIEDTYGSVNKAPEAKLQKLRELWQQASYISE